MKCRNIGLANPCRRNFLIYTCMSTSLFLLGPLKNADLLWASTGKDYYLSNSEKFMAGFDKTLTAAASNLKAEYGEETAQMICVDARKEFADLLPDLTYLGGDRHPGTKWMLLSGHWVALLRPMRDKGYSTQAAAKLMYDLYVDHLDTLPRENLLKKGRYMFTQEYVDMMKNWTQGSKGQRVDWVAEFVPGNGDSFDYGIDYHYCPCLEFFRAQKAADIAPYFCLVDFPEHKRMETGLVRSKTLAQGDDICNFRYKEGRDVTQDWSTEIGKFKG